MLANVSKVKVCVSLALGMGMVFSLIPDAAIAQDVGSDYLGASEIVLEMSDSEIGESDIQVDVLEAGKYQVTIEDIPHVINVVENGRYREVSYILNGVNYWSRYDKALGEADSYEPYNNTNDLILPAKSKTSYDSYRISYATLKSNIGSISARVAVASLLLGKFGPIGGIANAAGIIATIVGGMNEGLPNDPHHGVVVTVKTTKYSRKRNGRWAVWKIIKTIDSVNTY